VQEWLPKDKPEEITMDAANRAIEAQEIYKAKHIIGDSNGVGRGAMEYLFNYFHIQHPELGVTVIFFNAGHRAADDKRYYLRRDEMWFKKGRAWFASPHAHLPNLPGLKTQFTGPGYHEDTNKKIWVESKDDLFKRNKQRSGNGADAFLETLMVEIIVEEKKPEPPRVLAPVFAEHFARLKRREEYESGKYIR
jgi:hypothetical protein